MVFKCRSALIFRIALGVLSIIAEMRPADAVVTANDLYLSCSQKSALCTQYSIGVIDGIMLQAAISRVSPIFCSATEIPPSEIADLVVKGLDSDQKLKAAPNAGLAISIILTKKFPCKPKP